MVTYLDSFLVMILLEIIKSEIALCYNIATYSDQKVKGVQSVAQYLWQEGSVEHL